MRHLRFLLFLAGFLCSLPPDLAAQSQIITIETGPGGPDSPMPPTPGGPGLPIIQRDRPLPPEKTGTGIIRGRVVSADGGQPLRRVQLRAAGAELREGRLATTDEQGRFELKELPAGRYSLMAMKGGYITLQYGQRRPLEPGRPLQLDDGQVLEKIDFALPRGSVLAGRIVDEFGEPVTGAMIQATRYRMVAGQRRLSGAGMSLQTDDLGQFRVFGLSPGNYFLSASLRTMTPLDVSTERTGYAQTYYPGTPSLTEAQPLVLGVGEELSGLTFPLVPSRAANLSGIVLNSEGKPFTGAMVSLRQNWTSEGGNIGFMSSGIGQVKPDGSFTISRVAPGEYSLDTRSMNAGWDSEFATIDITVTGEDITGITLVASKGATARGRITFDTGRVPAGMRPAEVRVMGAALTPAPGLGAMPSTVHDDWTFEAGGLSGQRLIRVSTPPSWFVKSVLHDGVDVTDTPIEFKGTDVEGIEIVLTQKATDTSGTVTDSRGAPVKEYSVVVFAEDRARWTPQSRFIRTARPDQDGRFRVRNLPPERYVAVALDYLEPGDETNSDLLEELKSNGVSFTLEEGGARTLQLKLSTP